MIKSNSYFLIPLVCLLLFSCVPGPTLPGVRTKMRPIYIPMKELKDIRNQPPQHIETTGSIVLRGSDFFLSEQSKGIHVFDVSDDKNEKYLTFIKIPALSGFAVSEDRLYANQWTSLLTIDISDLLNVVVLTEEENVYQNDVVPPNHRGFFECVDPDKGAVIGWEEAILDDPQCRTI